MRDVRGPLTTIHPSTHPPIHPSIHSSIQPKISIEESPSYASLLQAVKISPQFTYLESSFPRSQQHGTGPNLSYAILCYCCNTNSRIIVSSTPRSSKWTLHDYHTKTFKNVRSLLRVLRFQRSSFPLEIFSLIPHA